MYFGLRQLLRLQMNNRGNVLQITLVLFTVLLSNILYLTTITIEQANIVKQIENIDEARLLELSIISHYRYSIQNDILLSNEITIDDTTVYFTVDDFGSYYEIYTRVANPNIQTEFVCQIDIDEVILTKFEYL